uniref:EOG090X0A1W n=1 Tax=Eubosmina coregoni TaxID=186181 RepID=A0A4Y7LPX5_9CRUS|nr:EOG090X0A1W [Eubosmina coregoni]SVE69942.1 EOG090X0A1W [Eubosmina coregoni]
MASLSIDTATQQVQERLKGLYKDCKQIQEEKIRNEPNLSAVIKAHDKLQLEDKISPYQKSKLKGLYSAVVADCQREEDLIREALSKIYEIREIRHERRIRAKQAGSKETIRRGALMKMLLVTAQTLPLWISRQGQQPPPLCGAIPADSTYVAKLGDIVAALVKSTEGDENWILAEVVHYLTSSGRYEVDDIDEEQKERHTLSKRRVIPLPLMRANPETDPAALFPKGATVMALYPQTTCFYKAVINQLPQTAQEEYQVLFEDSSYSEGFSPPLMVAQRYVITIAIKEKKK